MQAGQLETLRRRCAWMSLVLCLGAAHGAQASKAPRPQSLAAPAAEPQFEEAQHALDERRLVDAGRLIDGLRLSVGDSGRLELLTARLALAQGFADSAVVAFRSAEKDPAQAAAAMEGEGLALAQLGRGREAVTVLQNAVAKNPNAWRAWNAMGVSFDDEQNWPLAERAYEAAITAAPDAAGPLNNRGYSRLLQGRIDLAVDDFVAALAKEPDLAPARANLRLALALKGDYKRAVEAPEGRVTSDDRAAFFNNAGLAAAMRGDFQQAKVLLQRAMDARESFYSRASGNLALTRSLEQRLRNLPTQSASVSTPDVGQ